MQSSDAVQEQRRRGKSVECLNTFAFAFAFAFAFVFAFVFVFVFAFVFDFNFVDEYDCQ